MVIGGRERRGEGSLLDEDVDQRFMKKDRGAVNGEE
jgi:hypothetical protein